MITEEVQKLVSAFPEIVKTLQMLGFRCQQVYLNQLRDGQLGGQNGRFVPKVCFTNKHRASRKYNIEIYVLDKGNGDCQVEYRYADSSIPLVQEPVLNRIAQDRSSFNVANAVRMMVH